jgi:hypothetical protein
MPNGGVVIAITMTTILLVSDVSSDGPTIPERYPRDGFVLPLPDWDAQYQSHIMNGWPKGRSPFDLGKNKFDGELPPRPPPEKKLPSESPSPTPTVTSTQTRDYRKFEIPPTFVPPGQCVPNPTCVMPSYGPIEGGTRVTIEGSFLARDIEDVEEILICGSPCIDVQIEMFTNCVPNMSSIVGSNNDVQMQQQPERLDPCWYEDLPENELGEKIDRADKYMYRYNENELCLFESYKQAENRIEIMHEPRCEKQTSEDAKETLKAFPECELRHVHFENDVEQEKTKDASVELRKDRFREISSLSSPWGGPVQGLSNRHEQTWDGPVEGILFIEEKDDDYAYVGCVSSKKKKQPGLYCKGMIQDLNKFREGGVMSDTASAMLDLIVPETSKDFWWESNDDEKNSIRCMFCVLLCPQTPTHK